MRAPSQEALETIAGPEAEPLGTFRQPQGLDRLLHRHGIELTASAEVDAVEMVQDETQFRRMAGNLIKNALHHRRERMEIDLSLDAGRLVLPVADDGPGVDPAHRELIFRRYTQVANTTVARKGHGLGLAGALILARCLGGRHPRGQAVGAGGDLHPDRPAHVNRRDRSSRSTGGMNHGPHEPPRRQAQF